MTTLTRVPKSIQVQHLPYLGPKKKAAPKFRRFAIHINQDGCLPKIGSSYSTLEAACRKAAKLSEAYGTAVVMDQAQSSGQRMIRLFKRGLDYLQGA